MDKSCQACGNGSLLNPGECRRYPWHDAQQCREGGFSRWIPLECKVCELRDVYSKVITCMECDRGGMGDG
jgi:hypothetical protein